MADSFQFGFANPAGYSDWAKYAGLDRTTGGFATPSQPNQTAGVAPPQTINEYAQQAIAPVTKAFNNYSNAANQIGQGNVMGAVNAAKGNSVAAPVAKSADDYDFLSVIGL
jgi:hypothetical protein